MAQPGTTAPNEAAAGAKAPAMENAEDLTVFVQSLLQQMQVRPCSIASLSSFCFGAAHWLCVLFCPFSLSLCVSHLGNGASRRTASFPASLRHEILRAQQLSPTEPLRAQHDFS
jgi:hypothetical protein